MPHATLRAQMFKSPRKFTSDGRFTPEGTVQFQHIVSVEGEAQTFYCDTDLTSGLNGSRAKLDTGEPVAVDATLDLSVRKGKLQAVDLVKLAEVK